MLLLEEREEVLLIHFHTQIRSVQRAGELFISSSALSPCVRVFVLSALTLVTRRGVTEEIQCKWRAIIIILLGAMTPVQGQTKGDV